METPKVYELTLVNSRKSFYGKCRVIDDWVTAKLQSYSTIVAEFDHGTNKMKVNGRYSMTTASHINSFLVHFWFDTATKNQIETRNNAK